MTTIDEDKLAQITNKNAEELQVNITEDIISEALNLPPSSMAIKLPQQLSEVEKKMTFLSIPGKKDTFKDLIQAEVDLPLRLYLQHFVMGKSQNYTQPNRRVVGFMAKAVVQGLKQEGYFSYNIRNELIAHKTSIGLKEKSHLANGHMLMRIANQVLGIIEALPPPLSQEEIASREGHEEPKKKSLIISPRGTRRKDKEVPRVDKPVSLRKKGRFWRREPTASHKSISKNGANMPSVQSAPKAQRI